MTLSMSKNNHKINWSFSLSSGLKQIHALSSQGNYELRIDLEDFENSTAFAQYGVFGVGLFSVDPEDDGYALTVADYTGTAGTHTYLHIKYIKLQTLSQYLQYCAIRMPCLNHMLNIQLYWTQYANQLARLNLCQQ